MFLCFLDRVATEIRQLTPIIPKFAAAAVPEENAYSQSSPSDDLVHCHQTLFPLIPPCPME